MSSSAARKARIGEVPQAEGFGRINVAASQTFLFTTSLKAALRLWVNPFGSQASHSPYIALTRDTGGDIAAFPAFNYDSLLHCP